MRRQPINTLAICVLSLFLAQTALARSHSDASNDDKFFPDETPNGDQVELGKNLFYDKILSGNGNTACATCHHALSDTGDGLSLPVGEGAVGLGITRDTGTGDEAVHERVPRNSPPLFNLGAKQFTTLFHDGRIAKDPSQPSGFFNPAGSDLPYGLYNVLAAQAMFPVTSATEMAGQAGENPVADAAVAGNLAGPQGVWSQLAHRLQEIPEYVELFVTAFDDIDQPEDITYVHAANAIAAFEAVAWRADNSPYDRYMRGDRKAMSQNATKGMRLFYGKAGCSDCHSGKFQTNHQFNAIAMPQIGPGKGDGLNGNDDFGRERVTGLVTDRYKFRVPSLRNIALTGPWGHAGSFGTLENMVRHHLNPRRSLRDYDRRQVTLTSRENLDEFDFLIYDDEQSRRAIARANELPRKSLKEKEIAALMDFLHALTDPASLDLRHDVPKRVPSGLPIFE